MKFWTKIIVIIGIVGILLYLLLAFTPLGLVVGLLFPVGKCDTYKHGAAFNGADPSISNNGTGIVFASPRDGAGDIYFMNLDGSGWKRLTQTEEYEGEPAVSPDGMKISFVSYRDNCEGEIYIMNSDGSGQVRLTNNDVSDRTPTFSPDGSKILFRRQSKHLDLFVMDTNGANMRQFTDNTATEGLASFSPDGTKILYHSVRYDKVNSKAIDEIMIAGVDGSNPKRLQENASSPSFSPDGRRITFVSDRDEKYSSKIYVMDSDGTNVRLLTPQGGLKDMPKFTPDGSKIIFLQQGAGGRHASVNIVNSDGSGLKTVAEIY